MKQCKYLQVIILLTTCRLTIQCPKGCTCNNEVDDKVQKMACDRRNSIPPLDSVVALTMLNMTGSRLTVILAESFARSPHLEHIDLSFSMIDIVANGALGNSVLPKLVSLNISHNSLTTFPRNLSSNVQHLKMASNSIKTIHMTDLCFLQNLKSLYLDDNELTEIMIDYEDKSFQRQCSKGLLKLEILSLNKNKIRTIGKSLWKYLSQIKYLSIAQNQITSIKGESFKGLRALKYLDLSGNKIRAIATKAIFHFHDLKYLSLADNVIESFPEELPMVEWFDLSNNSIKTIPQGKKTSLYPQEVFLIGRNPLHCDCAMLWVKEFYDTREYQLKFIQIDIEKFIPVCDTPDHLKGDTWDVLANEAFGCVEHVQDSASQEEDKTLVWKLRDLSVKIMEVGDTYLRVEWDSVNIGVQSSVKQVIQFHIHPFGKKNQRKSVSVHPQVGRYVLKALHPSTAYVVCMSVTLDKSSSPVNSYLTDDCLEIVTRETVVHDIQESWVTFLLRNPTFYLVIVTLSVCFLYMRSS